MNVNSLYFLRRRSKLALTSTGHAVSRVARVTRAVERALGIAARGVLSTVVGCRVDTLVDVCSVDNKFGFISHALPKTSD